MIAMKSKNAFTMFEMMIVIMLLGVIMAFVGPRMVKYLGQAGKADIQLRFAAVKEALNEYKMVFGVYPATREGLKALVNNPRPNDDRYKREADRWPFVKENMIADKAGNEFEYRCPPEKKGKYKYYELMYLGPTQSETDPERVDDGM